VNSVQSERYYFYSTFSHRSTFSNLFRLVTNVPFVPPGARWGARGVVPPTSPSFPPNVVIVGAKNT
jgi:hypothetical protein